MYLLRLLRESIATASHLPEAEASISVAGAVVDSDHRVQPPSAARHPSAVGGVQACWPEEDDREETSSRSPSKEAPPRVTRCRLTDATSSHQALPSDRLGAPTAQRPPAPVAVGVDLLDITPPWIRRSPRPPAVLHPHARLRPQRVQASKAPAATVSVASIVSHGEKRTGVDAQSALVASSEKKLLRAPPERRLVSTAPEKRSLVHAQAEGIKSSHQERAKQIMAVQAPKSSWMHHISAAEFREDQIRQKKLATESKAAQIESAWHAPANRVARIMRGSNLSA